MSKHKRRKTGEGRNDCVSGTNCQCENGSSFDGNMNNLAGILGNIDINQITSLLNASGILGNKGNTSINEDKIKDIGGEVKEGILNNLDISQLLSQANELNSIINMNNYKDLEYEEEDSKHKTKQKYDRENDNTNTQQSGDSIVALLNVLKSLVTPDKAQIIDRIVGLYIEGKI
ncbi:hypothetical protein CLHOM_30900 [Clostridium homopropionicum DSM 5847]|uniref:Uncharacterized protein n=1 Tax=Clostridium homopropionicum DSM 5847 TaxID=1121318 RepID=A0A0L6Z5H9_9CLOT|nr:hypothetical protein [Clostridium homopropionicum]KOA18212.1 hypothetical protein CLHOM_30900 [Clostridium homopropionicum DSM 5847]SFF71192.1 hypothetical protein SAMN04488501_101391 [Clostridium homopropionicum]